MTLTGSGGCNFTSEETIPIESEFMRIHDLATLVEILPMHCCRSFVVLVVQVTFLILIYHALKVALENH